MKKSPQHHPVFWGRDAEIALLRQKNWRKQAELIILYGRRRVGKTSLVEHAYQNDVVWKFEGLEGESVNKQIKNFLAALSDYTGQSRAVSHSIRDWHDSLKLLVELLPKKRMVLFFDEFQWLADMKSGFVSLFKYFWDNHFKNYAGLRVVLCGSVSSFMVKKVIRSKALYGRVDTEMNLTPLKIRETGQFFTPAKTLGELIQINMIFGGIPQYLQQLQPGYSLIQNLNEQAFRPHGYFFQEYRRLFISHFSQNSLYEKIIHSLSYGPRSAEDVARACEVQTGGTLTERLVDLELAGFVRKETPFDKGPKSKLVRYRLDDEYLHFYFRFIKPNIPKILSGRFSFEFLFPHRDFKQWEGYAFERLCCKNADELARVLGFSGINYQSGPWFVRGDQNQDGAQVDLVFQRADSVLTICELKYAKELNSAQLIRNFERKCEALELRFPHFGQQKVLLLGKPCPLNPTMRKYFDKILFAAEVLT